MKTAVYSCRADERELFERFGRELGTDLVVTSQAPTLENAELAKGCQAVSVITTTIDAPLISKWHEYGIQAISTRTIGYEHVDAACAASLGIAVSNTGYSPNTVAEYTVMTALMAIRRMKAIMTRYLGQDYSLKQVRGREIRGMTVGVIGTGRIGETVIRGFSGFGCRILACDLHEKESVKAYASYVPLETIWNQCDLITLHAPATPETFHLVKEETIRQMKDGVVLVNTARGSLIDTPALIAALESRKVGAAALDVIENEMGIYYKDYKYQPAGHHEMAVLNAMPNVLMTPHTAFFTDEAVSDMIENSLRSCIQTVRGEENPWKVN